MFYSSRECGLPQVECVLSIGDSVVVGLKIKYSWEPSSTTNKFL